MAKSTRITIVGGGLAGLTLGIGLRQRDVPVTIYEAGHYPRHRVCGEFISGRGLKVLSELNLRERCVAAGAIFARTAGFFLGAQCSPIRSLPEPALCLSRYKLDELLAARFRELGGDLYENHRHRDESWGEGVVRASGRRLQTPGSESRWFGLKIHARRVPLAADLEMHGSSVGYVGICRLSDGEVNVCGLFRRPRERSETTSASVMEWLRGRPETPLRQRMAEAVMDQPSFCSVAGVSLQPQRGVARDDCAIGDALTMIPPVTGNGMSMAFEAADIAATPLEAFSRGEMTWSQARENIGRACDVTFARRLAAARWLQWMMFAPLLRTRVGSLALRSDFMWGMLFARTR